jgi:hypothetical protein
MTGPNEKPIEKEKIDLHPDAWGRFRQAVHVMAKAGPQHRIGGVAVKSEPKHMEKDGKSFTEKGSRNAEESGPDT